MNPCTKQSKQLYRFKRTTSQDSEIAVLHAKITDLNEHIVKISMASSSYQGNNMTRKSVVADPS